MKLTHFELTQTPGEAWWGSRRFGCPVEIKQAQKRESQIAQSKECISEREFEVDLFLSILTDIDKPHINMIEAGAGWGEWCLALDGVIKKQLIPTKAKTYTAIGIEGDMDFYFNMEQNFKYQNVTGKAIHGAISNKAGCCKFNTGFISHNYCGGSMSFQGTFKGLWTNAVILGLINLFTGKAEVVNRYSVDYLFNIHKLACLDILHIDVQGAEALVLKGAKWRLENGNIDYILVGTHAPNLHRQVKAILKPTHNIIAEALPGKVNQIADMPPVWIEQGQDGMILFKRK